MSRKKFGEMLVAAGVIDENQLRSALGEQRRWGGLLGSVLVDLKVVSEERMVEVLSRQLAIPAVDLTTLQIPQAVLDLVPGELAEQMQILPFAQPMKFLDVAMADPTNLGIADELRIRTQLNIRPHLAGPKAIERAIAIHYRRGLTGTRPGRRTGPMNVEREDASRKMEVFSGHSWPGPPPAGADAPAAGMTVREARQREAEIYALQDRLSRLEAMVLRDEDVLRKVLALLVDKGVATRDEILEKIR